MYCVLNVIFIVFRQKVPGLSGWSTPGPPRCKPVGNGENLAAVGTISINLPCTAEMKTLQPASGLVNSIQQGDNSSLCGSYFIGYYLAVFTRSALQSSLPRLEQQHRRAVPLKNKVYQYVHTV